MKNRKIIFIKPALKKNGNRYYVEYTWYDPRSGKADRRRVSKGFAACSNMSEREALASRICSEINLKAMAGIDPKEPDNRVYEDQLEYDTISKSYSKNKSRNNTLRPLLSDYLDSLKLAVAQKTFESYQSKCRIFCIWLENECDSENDISCITSEVFESFFRFLADVRKLSKPSLAKYSQQLRSIWKSFKKKGYISTMPEIEAPQVNRIVDMGAKPLNPRDLELLKQLIVERDPQLYLAISFEFYCFVRPGVELRNMKIGWIDLYSGIIRIPAEFAKNRTEQCVVIPANFLSILLDVYRLDTYDADLYVFGSERVPGYTRLGKNTLRCRFNRFRDELGLSKEYKFYSMKHTGAVMASNAGIPIKDLQMQMRHHSLDITDKYLRKMKGVDSVALKHRFPSL